MLTIIACLINCDQHELLRYILMFINRNTNRAIHIYSKFIPMVHTIFASKRRYVFYYSASCRSWCYTVHSSPVHNSGGAYPYCSNRTVDENFSQNIRACLHTALSSGITDTWLRIYLQTVNSIVCEILVQK